MPTFQPVSGTPKQPARINLDAWNPLPGENEFEVPEEHFLKYNREMMIRGDKEWPPSITSFYGHPIPLPNVELTYVGRGKTFLKVLVTFKKRTLDPELHMFVDDYALTVPAWQGENNLIHLIETLPGEDDENINLDEFYENVDDIDTDYLERMRALFSDEEITCYAPEVFYYPDPVDKKTVPNW